MQRGERGNCGWDNLPCYVLCYRVQAIQDLPHALKRAYAKVQIRWLESHTRLTYTSLWIHCVLVCAWAAPQHQSKEDKGVCMGNSTPPEKRGQGCVHGHLHSLRKRRTGKGTCNESMFTCHRHLMLLHAWGLGGRRALSLRCVSPCSGSSRSGPRAPWAGVGGGHKCPLLCAGRGCHQRWPRGRGVP